MTYEWDRHKARVNLDKHGIDFAEAVAVLEDDTALTMDDEHPDEERYITIGSDTFGRVLVVVYTWRGDVVRLISARKATPRERQQYEGNTV